MSLTFQGTEITKLTIDGVELDKLTIDGVEVFSKSSGPSFTLTFNPIGSPIVRYQSATTEGTATIKGSNGVDSVLSYIIVYNSNEYIARLVSPVAVTTTFDITLVDTSMRLAFTITAGNTTTSNRISYPNSFAYISATPITRVQDNNA